MPRTYSYDVKMLLSDGAAAYTADGIGQVASASAILNLGPVGDVRTDLSIVGTLTRDDYAVVMNISAITTTSDGVYALWILGSNNSDGSKPVVLGGTIVGLGASLPNGTTGADTTGAGSTTSTGRKELMFTNEQNGILYQYVYLWVDVQGSTSKSITLTAYVAKLPLT